MQQILFILFGWCLGIFGSIFLETKKRKQIKEDYKDSLITELKLVLPRLVTAYYKIMEEMGKLDKEKIKWIHSMISEENKKSMRDFSKYIKILLEDDEKLKSLNVNPQDIYSLSLRKFNLSFLQENISSYSLLDKEFRRNVIDIRTKINYLNAYIDKIDFFYKSSFVPNLSKNNHDILENNTINYYRDIADFCRITSEMIRSVIKNFDV